MDLLERLCRAWPWEHAEGSPLPLFPAASSSSSTLKPSIIFLTNIYSWSQTLTSFFYIKKKKKVLKSFYGKENFTIITINILENWKQWVQMIINMGQRLRDGHGERWFFNGVELWMTGFFYWIEACRWIWIWEKNVKPFTYT